MPSLDTNSVQNTTTTPMLNSHNENANPIALAQPKFPLKPDSMMTQGNDVSNDGTPARW